MRYHKAFEIITSQGFSFPCIQFFCQFPLHFNNEISLSGLCQVQKEPYLPLSMKLMLKKI